jgi:hypothetical protein
MATMRSNNNNMAITRNWIGCRDLSRDKDLCSFAYVETRHAGKHNTLRYYTDGSAMLTKSALVGLRLDELTDQHAQHFARQHSSLSPSGINRGLRTLRRALNLAFQWKSLDRPVKVTLATGERQRDRELNEND